MKNQFHITGLFYEIQGFRFRKYLNIKKKGSSIQVPDIMIVMMNPGGSKPIDGIDNNTVESDAFPDRTQDQIMKVMLACNLQYARVLNLTDIREPKSKEMLSKRLELDKIGISHSIFDARRRSDFNLLFIKNVPVIYAWGVAKELKYLAENAIETIDAESPIGIAKNDWAYYHPLPQVYSKQKEWVDKIIQIIKNLKNQG